MKIPVEVIVPATVVKEIGPVVAPLGTIAEILVELLMEKFEAGTPLKATLVTFVNRVPVMTTDVPTEPTDGDTRVIVGKGTTVKVLEEIPVPAGVVTLIVPVDAKLGTIAEIWVSLEIIKFVELVVLN